MSTEKLLEIVQERGLRVELRNGQTVLVGNKTEATPALLRVLKIHKPKIVEKLSCQPIR